MSKLISVRLSEETIKAVVVIKEKLKATDFYEESKNQSAIVNMALVKYARDLDESFL